MNRNGPMALLFHTLFIGFMQPLLACGVMAGAVWLTHHLLVTAGVDHPAILLPSMIVAGGVSYTAAALVLCRETAKDLLQLVKRALRKTE